MGALFTSSIWTSCSVFNELVGETISALAPVLAVTFCTKSLDLNASFQALNARPVLQVALIGALVNSLLHKIFFYLRGMQLPFMEGMLPIMVGDLLGT